MRNAVAIGLWLSFGLASAAPPYPTFVLRCGDVIDARIVGGPIHVQLTAQKTKELLGMRKPFVLRFVMRSLFARKILRYTQLTQQVLPLVNRGI